MEEERQSWAQDGTEICICGGKGVAGGVLSLCVVSVSLCTVGLFAAAGCRAFGMVMRSVAYRALKKRLVLRKEKHYYC